MLKLASCMALTPSPLSVIMTLKIVWKCPLREGMTLCRIGTEVQYMQYMHKQKPYNYPTNILKFVRPNGVRYRVLLYTVLTVCLFHQFL